MCLNSESYFDLLASFIRHLLILVIKSLSESGLRLGYFQKIYYFLISRVARMARHLQPKHFEKIILFGFCSVCGP